MKKIFNYLFIFICLFIFTSKVNAEVGVPNDVLIFDGDVSITFGNGSTATNIPLNYPYWYNNGQSVNIFQFNAMSNDILYSGNYLIDFYIVVSEGQPTYLSCSNLTSNFMNFYMYTGSWVTNQIKSSCVDSYYTKYNGYNAFRVLYKFTYTDPTEEMYGTQQFRFKITSGITFGSGASYDVMGSMSNISVYSAEAVEGFKTNKSESANNSLQQNIINQNQTIIDQNQTEINQNQTIIDQNNETNNLIGGESDDITSKSCGMICKLKAVVNFINPLSKDFFAYKLVELMLNMLKSLFIPENMDFVTNFVEALESKLGFIAAIPVKIIEFTMSLATATWSEFKSIQLPSISIFGYNFWNAQEIDLTEAINIFAPFKYVTDVICVVICAQTLNKWRERFTGGGAGK